MQALEVEVEAFLAGHGPQQAGHPSAEWRRSADFRGPGSRTSRVAGAPPLSVDSCPYRNGLGRMPQACLLLVVHNGHAPERQLQTGIGPLEVLRPKMRDCGIAGEGPVRFASAILPAYLRRTRNLEELLPLRRLLATLHEVWPKIGQQRCPSEPSSPGRVAVGSQATDAQDRERARQAAGILAGPRQLRCHSFRGIGQSPMAKQDLHAIDEAEIRAAAKAALDRFVGKYSAKYDMAAACLGRDRSSLLAFYGFPAEPLGRRRLPSCGTDHRLCR